MSSIVRRPSGQGVSGHTGPEVGPGRSVDDTVWDGAAPLTLADTGVELPDLGGTVIAQMLRQDARPRRAGDTYHRRRFGWRAQRGGIVLVRITQELRPRPDGRFEPAGPWGAPELKVLRAVGDPRRRVGDVPVDLRSYPHQTSTTSTTSTNGPRDRFSDAAQQVAYLPRSVRESLFRAVLDPSEFEAEALEYTRSDGSKYHSITALRYRAPHAVVVAAARQQGAPTWQVEQVTYDLDLR